MGSSPAENGYDEVSHPVIELPIVEIMLSFRVLTTPPPTSSTPWIQALFMYRAVAHPLLALNSIARRDNNSPEETRHYSRGGRTNPLINHWTFSRYSIISTTSGKLSALIDGRQVSARSHSFPLLDSYPHRPSMHWQS